MHCKLDTVNASGQILTRLSNKIKSSNKQILTRLSNIVTLIMDLRRWWSQKKQVKEMEVPEMKMLRFAMEVTKKDKIRNEYIRSTVKVERLGMKMRKGRLRWYGHVMRKDQEYVGKR